MDGKTDGHRIDNGGHGAVGAYRDQHRSSLGSDALPLPANDFMRGKGQVQNGRRYERVGGARRTPVARQRLACKPREGPLCGSADTAERDFRGPNP